MTDEAFFIVVSLMVQNLNSPQDCIILRAFGRRDAGKHTPRQLLRIIIIYINMYTYNLRVYTTYIIHLAVCHVIAFMKVWLAAHEIARSRSPTLHHCERGKKG